MKTRRLTKKYKNKRNRKSIKSRKIKNKSRKRILKGGVPPRGIIVRSSRGSAAPNSTASTVHSSTDSTVHSSRASTAPRPSSRDSIGSNIGISKLTCCDPVLISYEKKILDSINNFPASFDTFYNGLLHATTDAELAPIIESIKQEYIKKTTIPPQGAYLNMNGLKLVNFLRSKYKNNPTIRKNIETIISLLDQYGMSQGVRISDLEVIKERVDSRYFKCYKDLFNDVHAKLFKCGNDNCYPVSTSAVTRGCKPRFKPTLQTTHETDKIDE